MDFLQGYDSEGSEGSTSQSQNITAVKSEQNAIQKNVPITAMNQPKAKPKKKLDISILPPEIQMALTRGDSMYDSDDDIPNNSVQAVRSSNSEKQIGLSGLLPPPKHSAPVVLPSVSSVSVKKKEIANSTDNREIETPNSSYSDNEEEEEPSIPTVSAAANLFTFETSKPKRNEIVLPEFKVNEPVPVVQQHQAFHAGPTSGDYHNSTSSLETAAQFGGSSGGNVQSKRKRDRDVEQALLQGDLSSLETYGSVQEVTGTDKHWNSLKYAENKRNTEQLHSSFGLQDLSTVAPPSKAQSRKHQINTLAIQAAKMELSLLEAKGVRNKTKSETQGKYGW